MARVTVSVSCDDGDYSIEKAGLKRWGVNDTPDVARLLAAAVGELHRALELNPPS